MKVAVMMIGPGVAWPSAIPSMPQLYLAAA
jgi:hypothetical protein